MYHLKSTGEDGASAIFSVISLNNTIDFTTQLLTFQHHSNILQTITFDLYNYRPDIL